MKVEKVVFFSLDGFPLNVRIFSENLSRKTGYLLGKLTLFLHVKYKYFWRIYMEDVLVYLLYLV